MQPLARFPLRQPFSLHVIVPFPSLCLLTPPSLALFLSHFPSASRHLSPSYSLLRFLTLLDDTVYTVSPCSLPPLTFPARPYALLFFSHIHPRPKDPPRLVPFRTFHICRTLPYLKNNPFHTVYRTTYISEGSRRRREEMHEQYATSNQPRSTYSLLNISPSDVRPLLHVNCQRVRRNLKYPVAQNYVCVRLQPFTQSRKGSLGGLDFWSTSAAATRLGCRKGKARRIYDNADFLLVVFLFFLFLILLLPPSFRVCRFNREASWHGFWPLDRTNFMRRVSGASLSRWCTTLDFFSYALSWSTRPVS